MPSSMPSRLSPLQHRQGVQSGVTGAGDSRHRGRGHRLLPRPGHVRALPACRRAPVGAGGGAQRHRTVRSVPGETQAVHLLRAAGLLKELPEARSLIVTRPGPQPTRHTVPSPRGGGALHRGDACRSEGRLKGLLMGAMQPDCEQNLDSLCFIPSLFSKKIEKAKKKKEIRPCATRCGRSLPLQSGSDRVFTAAPCVLAFLHKFFSSFPVSPSHDFSHFLTKSFAMYFFFFFFCIIFVFSMVEVSIFFALRQTQVRFFLFLCTFIYHSGLIKYVHFTVR